MKYCRFSYIFTITEKYPLINVDMFPQHKMHLRKTLLKRYQKISLKSEGNATIICTLTHNLIKKYSTKMLLY